MLTVETALRNLMSGLLDAVEHDRWEEADADLETLVQEAVAAILHDRVADLALIARLTARAHTALHLRQSSPQHQDRGQNGEAMHRLGQLRAIALLVAAGRSRRPARSARALTGSWGPARVLLGALDGGAQTGQALVTMTGLKPEAVARALPELLAAGLVHAWPAGRLIVYERTGQGRRLEH